MQNHIPLPLQTGSNNVHMMTPGVISTGWLSPPPPPPSQGRAQISHPHNTHAHTSTATCPLTIVIPKLHTSARTV